MDVNKDQKLAPKELDCVLRALGINATEADLIEFIGERVYSMKAILNPIFSTNQNSHHVLLLQAQRSFL